MEASSVKPARTHFRTASLPLVLRSFILCKCLNCELSDSITARFSFKSGETFTFTQRLINIYTLHCLSFIFFRHPPPFFFLPSPFCCHHNLLSSPGSQLSRAYYSVCHTLVCAKRVLTRTPHRRSGKDKKAKHRTTADSSSSPDYWRGVSAPTSLEDLNTGAGRRGNNLIRRCNRRNSAINDRKHSFFFSQQSPRSYSGLFNNWRQRLLIAGSIDYQVGGEIIWAQGLTTWQ